MLSLKELSKIVKQNRIFFEYKEKYNLSIADPKLYNVTELEMRLDIYSGKVLEMINKGIDPEERQKEIEREKEAEDIFQKFASGKIDLEKI